MANLSHSELYSPEQYVTEAAAFRARVIEHKKPRKIPLGEFVTLLFEDQLTVRHRAQEMLCSTRVDDADSIQGALDACSRLIPDGSNLKASMLIEYADIERHKRELATLNGIEHRVYAEIEGQGRSFAIAYGDIPRLEIEKAAALHFMRFELTAAQITTIRAGAEFGFGIDDDRMRVAHTLKRHQRASLLADLTQEY